MLVSLYVKNFAIIDEVRLEFGKGFNALTGETGAGKSILIGSLSAVLGSKVQKDVLGKKSDYALIELIFETESEKIKSILEENDLAADGQVIISRKITASGRSILRINGEVVSQNIVRQLADELIDIHGQHEHQSLLYKNAQRGIVDSMISGSDELLKKIREQHRTYKEAEKEYEEAHLQGRKSEREIDLIRYELDEIEAAAIKECEDENLNERFRILCNVGKITESLSVCLDAIADDGNSAASRVDEALRACSRLPVNDEKLSEIVENLNLLSEQIMQTGSEIRDYNESLSGSEEEFAEVSERLDVINRLKNKYGNSVAEIEKYAEECRKKLAVYEDFDKYLLDLKKIRDESKAKLDELCAILTPKRKKAAADLSDKLTKALKELNFEYSVFEVRLSELTEIGENGAEEVEFYISTNLGEPLKKLSQCASGGELSRIMLAIKSVIADKNDIDALVFDEIDTGISGRTAQKVSEKITELSFTHQVICITHLPQIASMADTHFLIEKKQENGETVTGIRQLGDDEKIDEIARMTGGVRITENVRESAKEMLCLAAEAKRKLCR